MNKIRNLDTPRGPEPKWDATLPVLNRQYRTLKKLNIGHGKKGYNLRIGNPIAASEEQLATVSQLGQKHVKRFQICNELYHRATLTQNAFRAISEGGLTEKATITQRALYIHRGYVRPPILMRADMLDFTTHVELNIPGGGHALMQTIADFVPAEQRIGAGLAAGFAIAIKALTKKSHPRVALPMYAHKDTNRDRSATYFAKELKKHGLNVRLYSSALPDPKDFDILIRKNINNAVSSPGWQKVWDAYLDGAIEIEPPPTSLYETKISDLLPFHPETVKHFEDDIRENLIESILIQPGLVVTSIGQQAREVSITDLHTLPASERRFVLKYAGADGRYLGGSKGVFQLDGKRNGEHGAEGLIQRALTDWKEKNEPWILQPRIKIKHDYSYRMGPETLEQASGYARFMPFYVVIDQQAILAEETVLFSNNWKVHGNKQSVLCPVTKS